MAQVSGDAKSAMGVPHARPLSPHLQVWRWHVTMFASIALRASGIATYVGLFVVAGWALALAFGPGPYAGYMAVLGSIPGLVVLFGITAANFYHLVGGVRHMAFDTGHGFLPTDANRSAWVCIALTVAATVGVFAVGFAAHG